MKNIIPANPEMNVYEIIRSKVSFDSDPTFNIYAYSEKDPGFKTLVRIHRTKAAAEKNLAKIIATNNVAKKRV